MLKNADFSYFVITLEEQSIIQAAQLLIQAEKNKMATEPVRRILGTKNIETAYKVQHLISQLRLDQGAQRIGSKIGLTSTAVQQQLGVDQPDYGSLFNDMQVRDGGSLPFAELMQPKAEAEIAFVLSKDLHQEEITEDMVANSIDYAVAAIEIVGSRVRDWDIRITDTIADNASASHFVLGQHRVELSNLDLINAKMSMTKNGEVVSQGEGSACLGSPLIATTWLARTMKSLGQPLKQGDIILSGALGPMCGIEKADRLRAEIEGLGQVSIEIT